MMSNLLMISQQTVQNWSFMEKKVKSKGSIACMWTTAASILLKVVMKDATWVHEQNSISNMNNIQSMIQEDQKKYYFWTCMIPLQLMNSFNKTEAAIFHIQTMLLEGFSFFQLYCKASISCELVVSTDPWLGVSTCQLHWPC